MEDLPKTWDAYYDFFKDVQKKLRAQGMRHVYAIGFQLNTTGNDPNARFNDFIIAYGGQDIVTFDALPQLEREPGMVLVSQPLKIPALGMAASYRVRLTHNCRSFAGDSDGG
jgi:hypothetical protein